MRLATLATFVVSIFASIPTSIGAEARKLINELKSAVRNETDKIHQIKYESIEHRVAADAGQIQEDKKRRIISKSYFRQEWIERSDDPQSGKVSSALKIRNEKNQFEVDNSDGSYQLAKARVAEPWLDTDWPRDGAICLTPILSLQWLIESPQTEVTEFAPTPEGGHSLELIYHGETERKIFNDARISVRLDSLNRIQTGEMKFKTRDRNMVYSVKYEYLSSSKYVPSRAEFKRQEEGVSGYDLFIAANVDIGGVQDDPTKLRPEHYGISQAAVDAMSGTAQRPNKINLEFWAWIATAIFCSGLAAYWGKTKLSRNE